MDNWITEDDIIYNEDRKIAVTWCTYGNTKTYFLAQEYYYDSDIYEDNADKSVLVNCEITEDLTYKDCIEKMKSMIF